MNGEIKSMKKTGIYFFIFTASLYLLWAVIIPFGEAPDEAHRFDVANFIYQYKELPVAGDSRLYYGGYGVTYATNLSFPYILGSILMIISDFVANIDSLYLVHRLVSVISGVLSVFFTYKIGQLLKFETNYLYFFVAVFALVPQFSFINSFVNLDAFTVFIVILIMYLLLKAEKKQWECKYLIFLGIAFSLALMSYFNGYVILPAAVFYFFISSKGNKKALKKVGIVLLIMFLFAGPYFLRNIILYQELFGFEINSQLSEELAIDELKPSNRLTPDAQGWTLNEMLFDNNWLEISFYSFWAAFGPMSIWLPNEYYYVFVVISFLAIIGIVLRGYLAVKDRKIEKNILFKHRFFLMQIIIIVLTMFLSIYYSYFSDFQPQGRYLYPAYFSIIYLLTLGMKFIFDSKYKNIIYIIFVMYLLYLNFYSLYKLVFVTYYG